MCMTVMDCVLVCKAPAALRYQCITWAPERQVTFLRASLFGKDGLKVRLEPVLNLFWAPCSCVF